jgi:hypothetical protein
LVKELFGYIQNSSIFVFVKTNQLKFKLWKNHLSSVIV